MQKPTLSEGPSGRFSLRSVGWFTYEIKPIPCMGRTVYLLIHEWLMFMLHVGLHIPFLPWMVWVFRNPNLTPSFLQAEGSKPQLLHRPWYLLVDRHGWLQYHHITHVFNIAMLVTQQYLPIPFCHIPCRSRSAFLRHCGRGNSTWKRIHLVSRPLETSFYGTLVSPLGS